MSYTEPLINQIYRFVLAVGFGIIMGVLYELFVGARTLFTEKKWAIITQDISFSAVFAVLSFFFMLIYNEGVVRLNLIVAQVLGLYTFHITFGKKIVRPVRNLRRKLSKKVKKLKKQ